MAAPKFRKGDHVMVAADLGPSMSHFPSDCEAIVIYRDREDDTTDYGLYIKGHGEIAWYDENQLTLLEHARADLLKEWKAALKATRLQHSDLDWIFANGQSLLESGVFPGASAEALAACLGVTNMWGSHGEGFTYHTNARAVIDLATRFLIANDKAGWLEFCKSRKEESIHPIDALQLSVIAQDEARHVVDTLKTAMEGLANITNDYNQEDS